MKPGVYLATKKDGTLYENYSPEHIEKCEEIAKELKVDFRLRQYTEY